MILANKLDLEIPAALLASVLRHASEHEQPNTTGDSQVRLILLPVQIRLETKSIPAKCVYPPVSYS